jgi:hypothetical protein
MKVMCRQLLCIAALLFAASTVRVCTAYTRLWAAWGPCKMEHQKLRVAALQLKWSIETCAHLITYEVNVYVKLRGLQYTEKKKRYKDRRNVGEIGRVLR